MSDDLESRKAERAAEIAERIRARDSRIAEIRGNRHKVWHEGAKQSEYLCNSCGGSHTARGYCTGCGAPASMGAAAERVMYEETGV